MSASERDESWEQKFVENIATASFRYGNPQVITGPDGMQYFNLLLPELNTDFECFVIEKIIPAHLFTDGLGIAINADKAESDWFFHGAMWWIFT